VVFSPIISILCNLSDKLIKIKILFQISYEKGYRVDMRLHCISFSPVPKSIGKMGSYYSDTFSSPKNLAFKVSSTYSFMQNGNIMLDESSI